MARDRTTKAGGINSRHTTEDAEYAANTSWLHLRKNPVTSPYPIDCGCSWGWSPTIAGYTHPGHQFVLKLAYGHCRKGHHP